MEILVLRGPQDALEQHGLEVMAEEAGLVIQLPPEEPRIRDIYGQTYGINYLDVDPIEIALLGCIKNIRAAWESGHEDESHLAHSFVGVFLCFWFDAEMNPIETLIEQGRSEDLRTAAADFIAADFGALRGPAINLQTA